MSQRSGVMQHLDQKFIRSASSLTFELSRPPQIGGPTGPAWAVSKRRSLLQMLTHIRLPARRLKPQSKSQR